MITIRKDVLDRLVRENDQLRDVVCDIATTAPYGKRYVEAIYLCRRTIQTLNFQIDWRKFLSQGK